MTDKDNAKTTQTDRELASEKEVQRITNLIAEIKKTSTQENKTTESTEYEDLYTSVKDEIGDLIQHYLNKHNRQAHSEDNTKSNSLREEIIASFDTLINNTPSSEAEISIPTILSSSDMEKVKDLFLLLEEEVKSKTKKIKLKEIPLSSTTILNRADLEDVFQELGKQIIEESENQIKLEADEMEEIPSPSFMNICIAFLLDVVIITCVELFAFSSYKNIPLSKDSIILALSQDWTQLILLFFPLWFLIQASSLILTQATLGQSLNRIIVATRNNKNPSIFVLLTRLTLHFFNFLSLGIYSNLLVKRYLAKNQDGFYCPISKTKLTFKGFTEES